MRDKLKVASIIVICGAGGYSISEIASFAFQMIDIAHRAPDIGDLAMKVAYLSFGSIVGVTLFNSWLLKKVIKLLDKK